MELLRTWQTGCVGSTPPPSALARRGLVVVVLALVVGLSACARDGANVVLEDQSPARPSPTGREAQALSLCRDAANWVNARVVRTWGVYEARPSEIAAWDEVRRNVSGGPAASDIRSDWRDRPADEVVAICYFEAENIIAPRGPIPEDGQTQREYRYLVTLSTEEGHVPYAALYEEPDRDRDVPEDARHVK